MNGFKPSEQKILIQKFLLDTANSITDIFFTFYIYEQTGSLSKILIFKLWQFVFIPLGAFISDILVNKLNAIKTYLLSILTTIIFIGIIVSLKEDSVNYLIPLGIINGLVIGFRALRWNVVFQQQISEESKGRFGGVDRALGNLRSIILPALCAFYIGRGGSYFLLFVVSIIFFFLSIAPMLKLKLKEFVSQDVKIIASLKQYFLSYDLKLLLKATFFIGLRSSIMASIWNIIVLIIVGGMTNWGVYKTVFSFITVILSYTIGKNLNLLKSRFGASLSAIMVFFGMTFLALNFNFEAFLIYCIASVFFNSSYWNSLDIIRSKIIKRNIWDNNLVDEVQFLREIPLSLGRILPILILLGSGVSFDNDLVLRIIIMFIGIMPFIVYLILSKTTVVKEAENPFWQ